MKATVLWIDDDPPRSDLELRLGDLEVSVDVASTISVGIAKMSATSYDALILDFFVPIGDPSLLPEAQGLQRSFTTIDLVTCLRKGSLTREPHATPASTPVVFFSFERYQIERQLRNEPAVRYAVKSEVTFVEVLELVRQLLDAPGPYP